MQSRVHVVWSDEFTRYDFGPAHPMAPSRLELTMTLAGMFGLFNDESVHLVGADPAPDSMLALVHSPEYIEAVRRADETGMMDEVAGLGTEDDPLFPGMHEAAARIVAGSVAAAEAVWRGDLEHGVNVCGGLHHAMPDHASGFCIYNDAAVAIARLLELGAERVAYVDIDAHHGDGVQAAFWDEPRVMTVSIHESGNSLFPGTGFPDEIGGKHAKGQAVNVALPAGVGDGGWLRTIHAIVPPLLRAFEPQFVVTQHGCDSHRQDPLAHLDISIDAQRAAAMDLHDLVHEVAGGKWLALGGGGYDVTNVVPRSWTHLLSIGAHRPLPADAEIPQAWLDIVRERFNVETASSMSDKADIWWKPWVVGYDPEDRIDQAIIATRRAVFDYHGLDPYFD